MKISIRVFGIVLLIILFIATCSNKNGTDAETEGEINLNITVTANGTPAANIKVIVEALVWKVHSGAGGVAVRPDPYAGTQEDESRTDPYGKVTFTYSDKLAIEEMNNSIVIQRIMIYEGFNPVVNDSLERAIKKSQSLDVSYELSDY